MTYLWVKAISGRYWIGWEDHDGDYKTEGEVVGSERPSIEAATDALNELHWTLVAGGKRSQPGRQ